MQGKGVTRRVADRKRKDTSRFLLFGAPFLLLAYYVSFLVIADAVAGTQTAIASISPLVFTEVIVDPVGTAPERMHTKAVGDIDGDGLPDIIVGGAGEGPSQDVIDGLYWYTNPTWTRNTIVPDLPFTDGFSTDMQVGDVDGDGDLDIVIPRASTGGNLGSFVRWFENPRPAGNPATDTWDEHTIGDASAHDVELGDLNNDGLLDVVVRYDATTTFIQIDAATDQWIQTQIDPRDQEGLTLGDYDDDGDLDVATNGRWLENPYVPDGLAAMDMQWSEWTIDASRNEETKALSADINSDGVLDVIFGTSEAAGEDLAWYEPANPLNPTGTWTKHRIGFVDYDHSLQVGDIDLDGDIDVIAAEMHQSTNPDRVMVFYNLDGAGTSWDSQVVDTDGSHNIRVLDMDLDGDLDIVGANWSGGPLSLWRNELSSLDSWERHLVDADRPWRAVLIDSEDLDGDGLKDIVTGGWWYKNPGSPSGTWVRNTIGGLLKNMTVVADFDGDTDLDILGTQGEGSTANADFLWAENNGLGSFTIHSNITAGNGDFIQGVAIGPITGAQTEIYISWHGGTPVQRLVVPADPVSTTWPIDTLTGITQREDLSQGDIDGDLDNDLLLGTQWLENTPGGWVTHDMLAVLGDPDRNELADIDRDGKLDAVVGYEAISVAGTLAWYEQGTLPTDLWTEHVISNTIIGPMSVDVRDMDGDGDLDVIAGEHNLANTFAARMIVFENLDGAGGTWAEHVVYTGDEHHDGARTVDIDNDGDFDIVSIGWKKTPGGVFLYESKFGGASLLPIAVPDSYTAEQDIVFNLAAPGVLANDITPGTGIAAALGADVSDGTLNLNADGSFDYTPDPGYLGPDSFTYTVSNDTGTSAPALVTLNVALPNLPPVATPDNYSISRGGLLRVAAPGVLDNDSDPTGDTLQAQLVAPPLSGELALNSDGSFEYIHFGGPGISDVFTYQAADATKTSATVTVTIAITPALPREPAGLVAFYGFDDGSGSTVTDTSESGAALDLSIASLGAVTWKTGALTLNSSTIVSSGVPATKIFDAVTTSNAITVEAWIKPASLGQNGPARIVTLSTDSTNRNVTLGQDNAEYDARLRTTDTSDNGVPSTGTAGNRVTTSLQHVVYTRDAAGNVAIYVDGVQVATDTVTGNLSNWNAAYQFGLGNEIPLADDRPWLGEFRLVAIYDTALTQPQVSANHSAGPEAPKSTSNSVVSGTVSLTGITTGTPTFAGIGLQVTADSGAVQQAILVAQDGSFAVAVEDGTYTVRVELLGFQTGEAVGLVVNGADVQMAPITLLGGFVNSDSVVDGADIAVMLVAFGTGGIAIRVDGSGNVIDMNGDGVTNGADISMTTGNIGVDKVVAWLPMPPS